MTRQWRVFSKFAVLRWKYHTIPRRSKFHNCGYSTRYPYPTGVLAAALAFQSYSTIFLFWEEKFWYNLATIVPRVLFFSEATHINEYNKIICLFYIVLCGTVRDRCKCVKLSFSTLFLRKKGNKDRKNMFKWFNPLFLPQLCVNQSREVSIYSFPSSETSIF